ncbi:MAG: hypothetical protein Kow00121_49610 [Elainellaceae cyanobacterium]
MKHSQTTFPSFDGSPAQRLALLVKGDLWWAAMSLLRHPPSLSMIHIKVDRRCIQLSPVEQALAKAAASREAMAIQLDAQLAGRLRHYTPVTSFAVPEEVLKQMVWKYSEQLVHRALDEVRFWFTYSSGICLQSGYPPLFYGRRGRRGVAPNKSAIAAIGEGVAGLLAQWLYQCHLLARPYGDYPDLVLNEGNQTFLVEAKGTTQPIGVLHQTLNEELLRMAAYVSACAELDVRTVRGLLVGTCLISESQYQVLVTEVQV